MSTQTNTKEKTAAKTEKKAVEKKTTEKKATNSYHPKVENGKILFREGSSADYVLELYRKYGNDKKKLTEGLRKKVDAGEIKCANVEARINRVIFEIRKSEKAGATVV